MRRYGWTGTIIGAVLLPGCGGGGPQGNANSNDNSTPAEIRDFSAFTVFTYNSGPLSCAPLDRVAEATIVDLRPQGLGVRSDLTILVTGEPTVDDCAPAPPDRGCLTLQGPQTQFLSDDQLADLVEAFTTVEVLLDSAAECADDSCADSFDWDAEGGLSSARCAPAPRLSASAAQTIRDLLESLRSN